MVLQIHGPIEQSAAIRPGKQGHAVKHRTPQPEFPRGDILLDPRRRERTTENERQGGANAHEPRDALRPKLEHSVSRSGICRAQAPPADPNRFAINGLASSTSSAYRDTAGDAMCVFPLVLSASRAMRVLSAISASNRLGHSAERASTIATDSADQTGPGARRTEKCLSGQLDFRRLWCI
jgi:hypothetical protein